METKKCSRCGNELPLSDFNVSRKAADGLQYYCRSCCRDAAKELALKKKQMADDTIIVDGRKLTRVKKDSSELADFTPRQLMEELKRRGFKWDYMLEPQRKNYV